MNLQQPPAENSSSVPKARSRAVRVPAARARLDATIFAVAGALAPEIVLLYSKRWSAPQLTFEPYQYVTVTVLYVALAAIAAYAFSYRGRPTKWKGFCIGAGLPIVVSTAASFARDPVIVPRGETLPGAFIDLLALF